MGLTIHYSLVNSGTDVEVRKCVATLRDKACELPFNYVGKILDLSGKDCDYKQRSQSDPLRWLLVQAQQYVQYNPRVPRLGCYFVRPQRVVAFRTWPGKGCEPCNIGLCQYPSYIYDGKHGKQITHLSGWSWSSFCKTEYASNPRYGGAKNFLRCHLTVIALLDQAKALGCLSKIVDEGYFWEHRNIEKLVCEVSDMNAVIAAFGGRLKDILGDGLKMPVTNYPNYEQLEFAGQKRLPLGIQRLARLVQLVTRNA